MLWVNCIEAFLPEQTSSNPKCGLNAAKLSVIAFYLNWCDSSASSTAWIFPDSLLRLLGKRAVLGEASTFFSSFFPFPIFALIITKPYPLAVKEHTHSYKMTAVSGNFASNLNRWPQTLFRKNPGCVGRGREAGIYFVVLQLLYP